MSQTKTKLTIGAKKIFANSRYVNKHIIPNFGEFVDLFEKAIDSYLENNDSFSFLGYWCITRKKNGKFKISPTSSSSMKRLSLNLLSIRKQAKLDSTNEILGVTYGYWASYFFDKTDANSIIEHIIQLNSEGNNNPAFNNRRNLLLFFQVLIKSLIYLTLVKKDIVLFDTKNKISLSCNYRNSSRVLTAEIIN
jgi:hypothetical protein